MQSLDIGNARRSSFNLHNLHQPLPHLTSTPASLRSATMRKFLQDTNPLGSGSRTLPSSLRQHRAGDTLQRIG